MKIETQLKQNVENKDNNVQLLPEDAQLLYSSGLPFSQMINQLNNPETLQSYDMLSSIGLDYNYDSINMDIEDALFFINLTQEGQFSIDTAQTGEFSNLIQTQVTQNVVSQKSVEVTNQLMTLIEKANTTQKPVRISFDNDVSVIIKIDKHGKISAEFIPGSIEVENYLKNNIAALKQRFDEQNLPYNDLLYRQNSKQNRNRNREKGEQ